MVSFAVVLWDVMQHSPLEFLLGEHCMTPQAMAAKETIFHMSPIKREIYESHHTLHFCKIHASCINFVLINALHINPLAPSLNLASKFGSCYCFSVLILSSLSWSPWFPRPGIRCPSIFPTMQIWKWLLIAWYRFSVREDRQKSGCAKVVQFYILLE